MQTFCQLMLAALTILMVNAAARGEDGPFVKGTARIDASLDYLLYLPPGYAADKQNAAGGGHGWPLVLFLHGSGERGADVTAVSRNGLPRLIREGRPFPFIVVAPQCPADAWWDAQALHKLVEQLQQQYAVDIDRTYVTGLSMGGYGTWELVTRYPAFFAAAAPVCGGGDAALVIARGQLKTLPVWAFHGEKDPIVPVARTREMVAALQKLNNPNVKTTFYPDAGHDSWTAAYAEPDLYTWLLAQRRAAPATRPATAPAVR